MSKSSKQEIVVDGVKYQPAYEVRVILDHNNGESGCSDTVLATHKEYECVWIDFGLAQLSGEVIKTHLNGKWPGHPITVEVNVRTEPVLIFHKIDLVNGTSLDLGELDAIMASAMADLQFAGCGGGSCFYYTTKDESYTSENWVASWPGAGDDDESAVDVRDIDSALAALDIDTTDHADIIAKAGEQGWIDDEGDINIP
jgi:hypothetical protein